MDGNESRQGGQKAITVINNTHPTRQSTDTEWVTLECSCRGLVYGVDTKIAAGFKNSVCQRSIHICVDIIKSLPSANSFFFIQKQSAVNYGTTYD